MLIVKTTEQKRKRYTLPTIEISSIITEIKKKHKHIISHISSFKKIIITLEEIIKVISQKYPFINLYTTLLQVVQILPYFHFH